MSAIPLSEWSTSGHSYPTEHVLRHWLRPEKHRQELFQSGAIGRVNGRYVIFPEKLDEYVMKKAAQAA